MSYDHPEAGDASWDDVTMPKGRHYTSTKGGWRCDGKLGCLVLLPADETVLEHELWHQQELDTLGEQGC